MSTTAQGRFRVCWAIDANPLPCKRPAAMITAAGAGARLAHHSHILLLEGETYRFRQSLEQQAALPAAT